jgi:hypothetical protein
LAPTSGSEGIDLDLEEEMDTGLEGVMDPEQESIDPPEKVPERKAPDVFRYLTGNEGLELVNLECSRKSLLRAQGFLEAKKQSLIRLARSRQIGNWPKAGR